MPRSAISPMVEHDDLVGGDNGREPMRDHERGAVLRHALERVLNVLLGVAVERRGRLVEQQDRRRLQDGARDRDALLLAAGKFQAALADLGVVALRRERMKVSICASFAASSTSASVASQRP